MSAFFKLMGGILAVLLAAQAIRAGDNDDDRYWENQRRADTAFREELRRLDYEGSPRLHNSDHFAAIAFSPSTGHYGYSSNFTSLTAATQCALSRCKGSDAEVVVWAKNAYCALAVGKGSGQGWGWGSTAERARAHALAQCRKHATGSHIAVCVFSDRSGTL
jgi:Domain of unknown function (DUF4189)